MKKLLPFVALLVGVPLSQAHAQSKAHHPASASKVAASETLTNRSIIALTAAGLPPDVILAKIASSATSFDLSTNGLLALKQSKVDDTVLKAMLDKASGKPGAAAKNMANPAPSKLPKLDFANHPYVRNGATGTWSPLEKPTSSMKSKMVAMGYGGVKMLFQIPNGKSPIRLAAADSTVFLLNTFGTAMPEFVL